jgi:hypothetical protein
MASPELTIVAGALARARQPREMQTQDALAKRWRLGASGASEPTTESPDVIPLLDGWIRRLEREAGREPSPEQR